MHAVAEPSLSIGIQMLLPWVLTVILGEGRAILILL